VSAVERSVLAAIERLLGAERETAIEAIVADGGYSRAMAEWGLDAAATVFDREAIERTVARTGGALEGETVALSLAKSVATAPLRSMALPLLRGARALKVRAPRAQRAFGRIVGEALRAEGLAVEFDESQQDGARWCASVLNTGASVLVSFGGDAAVERGRALASASGARFEGHGHGAGASWVDGAVSDDAVLQIAWDFCAYDGAGCLSPSVLWVTGALNEAVAMGARVAQAMARWASERPRGATSREWAAHERSWRAGAAAAATSFEGGRAFCVVVFAPGEGEGVSAIGARNVVVRCAGPSGEGAARWVSESARWLTTVSGDEPARARVSALGLAAFRGRLVEFGAMQRPPLDGEADPRGER
jgi:hypothetical protein